MASKTSKYPPIQGLDLVGRGLYLRPQQTYELKGILFPRANEQEYYSKEAEQTYVVPEGYEVNDSPPMPAAKALNQTMVEESWERFDKQTSVDTALTVGAAPFSVDVNASQMAQLRTEEEAYYALRNSFVPLWTVYIPDSRGLPEGTFDLEIPVPYSPIHRRAYERFFERFGTHYVKRAWVGGKAMLAFTIAKSSKMTKDDIKAGLKASQVGFGSGSANAQRQQEKEKLQNNSECTVFGKGGDELKLAALSSLDEAAYNDWLATVKDNPQVIEFDACGIWTLVDDDAKSQALREAYTQATVFTPLRAVFNFEGHLHFFRSTQHISYDMEHGKTSQPAHIRESWPILYDVGFEQIDAAFVGKYLNSSTSGDLSRKLYFFNRDQYIRIDGDSRKVDPGYPKSIAEGWPGVGFDRIDAALNVSPDALYFFRGNEYIRFNMLNNRADEGYPRVTSERWIGLTFDRIDAAVYWGNAKVYFFRGNQYIRYDTINFRVDPGYPKFLVCNYVEDWKFFD
ncbi:MAG: hemopexin repeat-containing protein [Gammaproteobacteria bacterium]